MGKFAKNSGTRPPKKNDDSESDNNFFDISNEKKDEGNINDKKGQNQGLSEGEMTHK